MLLLLNLFFVFGAPSHVNKLCCFVMLALVVLLFTEMVILPEFTVLLFSSILECEPIRVIFL